MRQTLSWCCIPVPGLLVQVHSRTWVLENYLVYICSAVIHTALSCNLFLVLQWKAWHSALIITNFIYVTPEVCPWIWEQGKGWGGGGGELRKIVNGIINPKKLIQPATDVFQKLMWWDHLLPHHNSLIQEESFQLVSIRQPCKPAHHQMVVGK